MKALILGLTALLLYDVLLNHSLVLKSAGARAGQLHGQYAAWNAG